MSGPEKAVPTAAGDASAVAERRKTDPRQAATGNEPDGGVDAWHEEATSAEDVTVATLHAQSEMGCSTEENSGKAVAEEEVDEASAHDAEIAAEAATKNDATSLTLTDAGKTTEETTDTRQASRTRSEEKDDKPKQSRSNNAVSKLEAEVRKRTKERDSYQRRLEEAERKVAILQASHDSATNRDVNENDLQRSVEQLRGQLAQTALMYDERNRVVANQENQINALNNQVASLKEVVSITRDLLQIRNLEVKQLQTEVDSMEGKIAEERERHSAMLGKMDAAMRLNTELKKEYETQLSLFQSLREKYGEKITLLTEEKRALETSAASASSAPE